MSRPLLSGGAAAELHRKGVARRFSFVRRRRGVVASIPAYAATEGAIDTLVEHFASLLGARGIRVNAVAPGVIETDMSAFAKTDAGRETRSACRPLSVSRNPTTIGGVVAFLASDDARWITGDTIHVDGGSKL